MPEISFVLYEHCLSSAVTALIDAFSICNSLHEGPTTGENGESELLFNMTTAAVEKNRCWPTAGSGSGPTLPLTR